MKKYTQYKDSGIEWLGNIPSNWSLKKLKVAAHVRFSSVNKKSEEGEQQIRLCNYVDVYYNDRITSAIDFMVATASTEEIDRFKLRRGDVLVTKDSEEWDDIAIPAYVAEDFVDVICGYHLAQIRSWKELIDGRFLFWLLFSHRFNHQFKVEASGVTRYGLSNYALSNGTVLVPSLDEQKIIADYLDYKIVQIDSLINKKERMIELLKEERTVIINQAVTKGLDPNVEMKDSGVEWLGAIPQRWNMARLRFLCNITTGDKDTVNREAEGAYPFFVRSPTVERISTYSFDGEAVLTAGDGVGVGKVFHYYNGKFDFHQRVYMFYRFRKIIGRYFFYFLRTNLHKVVCRGDAKSTVDSVRLPFLQDFPIVFPDVYEQEKIVLFIDRKLDQIDDQIRRENESIDLLKEYRIALITEVVTGKIDVRH